MSPNLAIQEIHDTLRAGQARYAMPERDRTDWCAMWRQRGVRLEKLAAENEQQVQTIGMLSRRCAEQARRIGVLMCQDGRRLTVSVEEVIAALRERADEDGALHFDAIRDVLIKLGARP